MNIKIEDATASQLAAYAATHWGIDVNHRAGKADILAKLELAGFDKDEITVDVEPVAASGTSEAPGRKTVRVKIDKQQGVIGGTQDVGLGCNGKVVQVKRGVEVDLPVEFFESLKNAVAPSVETDAEGRMIKGGMTPRYAYSVIG